ncbi:SDR family NAD(P)-dependent oxidoreductase [Myxococcus sp. AB036A]|uniref:SDR family NAD(P)-dependent oxidoreductase n=1 Tax=Myxococcus sp. AB036A TaxID=2562793 RepID=UPI001E35388C|nr:SDR family NAD(P)-dependent oxidoreductase [Myxococcus sp. AB036A]
MSSVGAPRWTRLEPDERREQILECAWAPTSCCWKRQTRPAPGTVHTAARAIQDAGGQALAAVGDVWEEADVRRAVDEAAARFGGIDCCVNNASVLASHPHIVPLSPPVNLSPRWLGPHPAYRMATY